MQKRNVTETNIQKRHFLEKGFENIWLFFGNHLFFVAMFVKEILFCCNKGL